MWKKWDTAIRAWLCKKHGHKYWVGFSGYYKGMPQSRCWRCGKAKYGLPDEAPLGNWFS